MKWAVPGRTVVTFSTSSKEAAMPPDTPTPPFIRILSTTVRFDVHGYTRKEVVEQAGDILSKFDSDASWRYVDIDAKPSVYDSTGQPLIWEAVITAEVKE